MGIGGYARRSPPVQASNESWPGDRQRQSWRRHAEGNVCICKAASWTQARVNMRLQYLVRINKDPGSDWGASVPDLPGCVATGKTIDMALRRIQTAIQLHLRGMRADGQKIP